MPQLSRHFQSAFFLFILPISILLPGSFSSCASGSGKSFVPSIEGYNENNKELFVLKKNLLEISGLCYLGNDSFAAINDEEGKIFIFKPGEKKKKIQTIKFAGKGDYEDMVKSDSAYFVLESKGIIHEVRPGSEAEKAKYKFKAEDKIEFESLVLYPDLHKLVLISKDHRLDKDAIYGYSFDLVSKTYSDAPFFVIPMHDIRKQMKDFSATCKPSGAAINPVNGKLFIVASIGKVLLQCSRDGKVERSYKMNPGQFQQPEGITFAPNGDMYISNEGAEGKATVLKFPYKQ